MERSGPIRGGEYERPRRPNPDTVAYLRSLPFDVNVATEEINQFLESDAQEYPQSFAAALSVLEEIQNELASLAGDELSAEIIEFLARILAPYSELAARKLLHATAGYGIHLSSHRYGSHVLQTILQLSVTSASSDDLAKHKDAPPCSDVGVPSLVDLLMNFQEELAQDACDLAVHICASHVMRALLCVLGGVELKLNIRGTGSNPFRRGKKKSKKKKKPVAEEGGGSTGTRMLYSSNPRFDAMDPVIEKALQQLTSALSGDVLQAPGALQELACHSSGGPLLSVLVRVLTYRTARKQWEEKLNKWEVDVVNGVDHHLGQVRPEPRFEIGSPAHKLAERMLCWERNSDQQKWAADVIFGLAGEPRGSHCLETLLQLSPNELYSDLLRVGDFLSSKTLKEYADHSVSRFVVQTIVATVRTQDQAEKVLEALDPLVSSGFILDPAKKIRSILWRMAETASKFDICQESLQSSIITGFATTSEGISKLQPCICLLLDAKKPERDGERLSLDVAGTRAVHYMLRFEPRRCKHVLSGILELSSDLIELLMKDGLGSRCILDGMLEGPIKESVFSGALAKLTAKLSGRWVAISTDRIGHHVVKKLFYALKDLKAREELVKELVDGKVRLSGNSMGRTILSECLVHDYEMNGSKEWNRLIKKRLEKDDWLDDIVHGSREGARKRREADEHSRRKKKSRTNPKMGTVDSIMDAIQIPGK